MTERISRTRRVAHEGEEETVTTSGGNVFADLGLPDADELAAKADLARAIRQRIEARGMSQREAAPVVGVSQPDLSNLYRRRLDGFSIERLSRMLYRAWTGRPDRRAAEAAISEGRHAHNARPRHGEKDGVNAARVG